MWERKGGRDYFYKMDPKVKDDRNKSNRVKKRRVTELIEWQRRKMNLN